MSVKRVGLLALVVCFAACGNGSDAPLSLAGDWGFLITQSSALACLPPGLLDGDDGLPDEVFTVSQAGDSITAVFADEAGNEVRFAGTYKRGRVTGALTIRRAGVADRVIGVDMQAFAQIADNGEPMVDGRLTILSDSDGACTGAESDFWAMVGPSNRPQAVTGQATDVTGSGATLNGTVNPNGFDTFYFFEWGTTALDQSTTEQGAGSGTASMPVQAPLGGLAAGTTYQFRLVARTGTTFVRGATQQFTTLSGGGATIAFVGRGYSNDVDVVDVDTMTVLDTIVGAGGYRMAVTPDGAKLYGTTGGQSLTVCDAVNFTLTTSFNPATGIMGATSSELEPIVMSPDGSRVFVADEQGNTNVFVIDTATDTVVQSAAPAMDEPENAAISPDGAFLYIVDNSDVLKIDTATLTIVGSASVASDAHGVAINADGSRVYAETISGVSAFDTATMTPVATAFGAGGYYLEANADGSLILGVDEGNEMYLIDTSGTDPIIVTTLRLSGGFVNTRGVTTTRDNRFILLATRNGLYKIDATSLEVVDLLSGSYQSVVVRP